MAARPLGRVLRGAQRLSQGDVGLELLENAVGTVQLLYPDIASTAAQAVLPHDG